MQYEHMDIFRSGQCDTEHGCDIDGGFHFTGCDREVSRMVEELIHALDEWDLVDWDNIPMMIENVWEYPNTTIAAEVAGVYRDHGVPFDYYN